MASITTRQTGTTGTGGVTRKDLPLTNTEIDNNFINLNNNKLENSNNLSDLSSASAARSNLGLGTLSTQSFNAVNITGGTISGITDLAVADGGTGLSSSGGNGFLLIGNSSNTFTAATLTGTANRISVTNASGSITLSTPQDIHIAAGPQFNSLGIGVASSGTAGRIDCTNLVTSTISSSGSGKVNSFGVGTDASGTAGEIRATDNITAYYSSDKIFKENIKDVENALNIVCSIGAKTFDWTDDYIESRGGEDGYFIQKSDFGVIAQDVQNVFPQAVRIKTNGTLAVDYEKLAVLSFGAIKQLLNRIEILEEKL